VTLSHKHNSTNSTQPHKPEVVICIITFKRPHGLQRLLESIQQQVFIDVDPPAWQVVVVDNDVQASAKAIVEKTSETFPVQISYGVEPVQGIASARNKSISLAPACDLIAFIDDDEVADPRWLEKLLQTQKDFQADIVTGPVLPAFDEPPPRWIERCGLYERRRLPTGTTVHFAATHNTLVKYEWMQKIDGPFDVRFNLTGGSDSHFSRKVIYAGGIVVWADEAIVKEYNPPGRMKASWLLQRGFRLAYTTTLIEKDLYAFKVIFLRFLKALYIMGIGFIVLLPFSLIYGYAGMIKALYFIARGAGALFGLFGGKYEEYARKKHRSKTR
jgi:succinoglycan biosynthesis protein ExoM